MKAILLGMLLLSSALSATDNSAQEKISTSVQSLEGWLTDISEARRLSQEKQKPLLIAFLGPNWCPYSDKFEEGVISKANFMKTLGDKVVFLKIDIPQDFEKTSFNGSDLKRQYQIEECPVLVLSQSNGEEIAKIEFLEMSTEDYSRYINQILSDFNRMTHMSKSELKNLKIDEIKHLYTRAGCLADATIKQAFLDQGLKVDRGPYFLLEQYGALLSGDDHNETQLKKIRNKIFARDPHNALGSMRKLAVMDFEALASVKNPQKSEMVIQPIVEYLKKFGMSDRENAWQLELKLSQYFFTQNKTNDALEHAQASLKIAPEIAQKDIEKTIDYLQTCKGSYIQTN